MRGILHYHTVLFCRCQPLYKGQSGSLVFVIDAKTGFYYRLGQLIGSRNMPDEYRGPVVYQAVVLSQSLDEFRHRHHRKLKELILIGQKPNNQTADELELEEENRANNREDMVEAKEVVEPEAYVEVAETTEAASEHGGMKLEVARDEHQETAELTRSEIRTGEDKANRAVNQQYSKQVVTQRNGTAKTFKLKLANNKVTDHSIAHLNKKTENHYCKPIQASDDH